MGYTGATMPNTSMSSTIQEFDPSSGKLTQRSSMNAGMMRSMAHSQSAAQLY